MANKRMFSNEIIDSDKFLSLSGSAMALYFLLNLSADDDGINTAPQKVMRDCRASEEDMMQLIRKNYVIALGENYESVVVIRHWLIHNSLRNDTYKESLVEQAKEQIGVNRNGEYEQLEVGPNSVKLKSLAELQELNQGRPLSLKKIRSLYKPVQDELDTFEARNVDQEREEKNRSDQERESTLKLEPDNLYGAEKNILLLPEELKILDARYEDLGKLLDKVSFILLNAKQPRSHYGYIQKIALEDGWPKKRKNRESDLSNTSERQMELELWYDRKKEEYGVASKEEVDAIFDKEDHIAEAKRRLMKEK